MVFCVNAVHFVCGGTRPIFLRTHTHTHLGHPVDLNAVCIAIEGMWGYSVYPSGSFSERLTGEVDVQLFLWKEVQRSLVIL